MTVRTVGVTLNDAFQKKTGTALCASGEKVVGGGYNVPESGSTGVSSSFPSTNPQGWSARGGLNFGWLTGSFSVYAVCAAP